MNAAQKATLLKAEQDVALAIASGYDPFQLGIAAVVPYHPDLQRAVFEKRHNAVAAQQNNVLFANFKQNQQQEKSDQAAEDNYMLSLLREMEEKRLQKWLNESHSLGHIRMTGHEWAQLAEHARDNRADIKQQLLNKGYDSQKADDRIQALDIMARGPRNDDEKTLISDADKDLLFTGFVGVLTYRYLHKKEQPTAAAKPEPTP